MKIIVANLKMNLNVPASAAYFVELGEALNSIGSPHQLLALHDQYSTSLRPGVGAGQADPIEIVVCPTFLALQTLNMLNDPKIFSLGAQNCSGSEDGAYTGEVSASMLAGIAEYVIVGHSERRRLLHETDHEINQKVLAALRHGLKPILCVGEDRNEDADDVLRRQLDGGLSAVQTNQLDQVLIAYEPVYAIGSGRTAIAGDISRAVNTIKSQVEYMFGAGTRILYGGSVDDTNASQMASINGIDGLLVGGASLNVLKFAKIVNEMRKAGG